MPRKMFAQHAPMNAAWENASVATRLRSLIAGHGELSELASRLHVHETALRMSIDEMAPYPTMDVIIAIVREYGVDPHWLFTGEYDATTHRAVLDGTPDDMVKVVKRVVHDTPAAPMRLVRAD
jgi:hypothetical protein